MFKDANFLLSLPMEAFLIANDFQSHLFARFVIVAFHYEAERAFAENLQNFEA